MKLVPIYQNFMNLFPKMNSNKESHLMRHFHSIRVQNSVFQFHFM